MALTAQIRRLRRIYAQLRVRFLTLLSKQTVTFNGSTVLTPNSLRNETDCVPDADGVCITDADGVNISAFY